jgi:hypothetical protein
MKIGPFSIVDMYGTPQSPAQHVIEWCRLIDYDLAKDAIGRNAKENFRARGEFDPKYRARCCGCGLRSRMKTSSRCRSRRPSRSGPQSALGWVLYISSLAESPRWCHGRTSRISERQPSAPAVNAAHRCISCPSRGIAIWPSRDRRRFTAPHNTAWLLLTTGLPSATSRSSMASIWVVLVQLRK